MTTICFKRSVDIKRLNDMRDTITEIEISLVNYIPNEIFTINNLTKLSIYDNKLTRLELAFVRAINE